jgi:hypothetical protein
MSENSIKTTSGKKIDFLVMTALLKFQLSFDKHK